MMAISQYVSLDDPIHWTHHKASAKNPLSNVSAWYVNGSEAGLIQISAEVPGWVNRSSMAAETKTKELAERKLARLRHAGRLDFKKRSPRNANPRLGRAGFA
jgi:hypothetical protein